MKEARLGGARRHLLHLGDFGEGQPLDEEQLRGEPLVPRQRGESLANGQRVVRRGADRVVVASVTAPVRRAVPPTPVIALVVDVQLLKISDRRDERTRFT